MMEESDMLNFIDPEDDSTESPEDRAEREYGANQQELLAEFSKDVSVDHLSEFQKDAL